MKKRRARVLVGRAVEDDIEIVMFFFLRLTFRMFVFECIVFVAGILWEDIIRI